MITSEAIEINPPKILSSQEFGGATRLVFLAAELLRSARVIPRQELAHIVGGNKDSGSETCSCLARLFEL